MFTMAVESAFILIGYLRSLIYASVYVHYCASKEFDYGAAIG